MTTRWFHLHVPDNSRASVSGLPLAPPKNIFSEFSTVKKEIESPERQDSLEASIIWSTAFTVGFLEIILNFHKCQNAPFLVFFWA